MHWAQGAERARVVPPRNNFGREISFLATLSPQLLPASSAPGKLRLRQTDVPDLEAECALTQKNGIGVERTLIPTVCVRDPEA